MTYRTVVYQRVRPGTSIDCFADVDPRVADWLRNHPIDPNATSLEMVIEDPWQGPER